MKAEVIDLRVGNHCPPSQITERQRLEAARKDYLNRGNQLMRMSRQCSEEANVCFDNAQLVEDQLRMMP